MTVSLLLLLRFRIKLAWSLVLRLIYVENRTKQSFPLEIFWKMRTARGIVEFCFFLRPMISGALFFLIGRFAEKYS